MVASAASWADGRRDGEVVDHVQIGRTAGAAEIDSGCDIGNVQCQRVVEPQMLFSVAAELAS
jgi:hypothetical protein